MSTLKTNNVQVGQSVTATNNFTLYQPSVPDGTVRLGVGNSGATTADVITATSAGNVGIGTSSPDRRLTVSSSGATYAKVTTTATNQIAFEAVGGDGNGNYFGVDTSGGGAFGAGAYGRVIYCNGAYPLAISTNGSERMRIDSSGNFLFNKTSTAASGSGVAFETNDTSSFYRGGDGSAIRFFRSSTQVGRIDVTGTATSYVTSSDYRLKENVQPMTGALARVALLKPCTYTWKSTGEASQGFIAHELAQVCPDAVSGEKDAVDEDGNIKPQGIDTSFLVATLTAAIQELKAEVDALKVQLAG
jgi:hypothetical protein